MFNAKCLLILTLLLTSVYFYGCSETTNPVVEEPVVEEPVVEINFCSVGDVLQPGESCLNGNGDALRVLEDGTGQYWIANKVLFIHAGAIHLNLPGIFFSAEMQDDGTWKILGVTPKE